jgi:hypothetical protein
MTNQEKKIPMKNPEKFNHKKKLLFHRLMEGYDLSMG